MESRPASPITARTQKNTAIIVFWLLWIPMVIPIYFSARWLFSNAYVAEARRLEHRQDAHTQSIYIAWARAYEISPMNPEAVYGLANFYFNQGEKRKADIAMGEFLRLAPHQSNALNFAADLKLELKDYDAAEQLIERAITIEPQNPILLENREAIRKSRLP